MNKEAFKPFKELFEYFNFISLKINPFEFKVAHRLLVKMERKFSVKNNFLVLFKAEVKNRFTLKMWIVMLFYCN